MGRMKEEGSKGGGKHTKKSFIPASKQFCLSSESCISNCKGEGGRERE